jgi:hypothetical protein
MHTHNKRALHAPTATKTKSANSHHMWCAIARHGKEFIARSLLFELDIHRDEAHQASVSSALTGSGVLSSFFSILMCGCSFLAGSSCLEPASLVLFQAASLASLCLFFSSSSNLGGLTDLQNITIFVHPLPLLKVEAAFSAASALRITLVSLQVYQKRVHASVPCYPIVSYLGYNSSHADYYRFFAGFCFFSLSSHAFFCHSCPYQTWTYVVCDVIQFSSKDHMN